MKRIPDNPQRPNWVELVEQQVRSMRFGVVQIVVHESEVVQIERTEKLRLERTSPRTE